MSPDLSCAHKTVNSQRTGEGERGEERMGLGEGKRGGRALPPLFPSLSLPSTPCPHAGNPIPFNVSLTKKLLSGGRILIIRRPCLKLLALLAIRDFCKLFHTWAVKQRILFLALEFVPEPAMPSAGRYDRGLWERKCSRAIKHAWSQPQAAQYSTILLISAEQKNIVIAGFHMTSLSISL